jgi:tRNA(Ile)-lysidine synthase
MLEESKSPATKSTDLLHVVDDFIKEHDLITPKSTVIVGLSGGPDSVCLLSILKKLEYSYGLTIIAAHLDHGWRVQSEQDAVFCKELAGNLGVQFIQSHAERIKSTKPYNGSKEEQGRILRRQFFESLAIEVNANAIALGHHQNDQQETFFMRMIRGASISGLASMRPKHGLYIRPLLPIHKQEILAYLASENLGYIIDETNDDTSFLRNAIRHQVLPALRSCDSRFDKNFAKSLSHIQEAELFLERLSNEIYSSVSKENGLNIVEFLSIDSYLQHRVLLTWLCEAQVPFTPSTAFFNEIVRFFRNNGNKHHLAPSWNIVKNGAFAEITKI